MAHTGLDAVIIPDSATIGSQVSGKTNKPGGSVSPSESLFGKSNSDSDIPLASKSTTPSLLASSMPKPAEPLPNKIFSGPSSSLTASTSGKVIPAHLQRKLNPRVKPMALPKPQPGGPVGISTKARISGLSTGNIGPRSTDSALRHISPSVSNSSSIVAGSAVASELPKTLQPSSSTAFDATRWLQENIVSMCDLVKKCHIRLIKFDL